MDLMRVHLIDVGYGDALLIQLPDGHNMLVDAGDREHAGALAAYLDSLNVRGLAAAVITHPHKNHFEGYVELLKTVTVGRVFINGDQHAEEGYAELLNTFGQKGIPVTVLARGDALDGLPDKVALECLHPAGLDRSINHNALVLKLTHTAASMILFADVGEAELKEILGAYPDLGGADAVLVPHHGRTVSPELIDAFAGKIFVISTGPNRWGPPEEEQIKQLKGQVYRTDRDGTVILQSDGERFDVVKPRP